MCIYHTASLIYQNSTSLNIIHLKLHSIQIGLTTCERKIKIIAQMKEFISHSLGKNSYITQSWQSSSIVSNLRACASSVILSILPYYIHSQDCHLVQGCYQSSSHQVCIPGSTKKKVEWRTRKHNSQLNYLPLKKLLRSPPKYFCFYRIEQNLVT